ncbi:zinc finger protein 579-like [Trifolium pratense]|uniref:zinc finger protein 579-like n=1 Tax=Trifolium pratense TaxID=57577 RepID=UPI001E6919E5|nr:zinc finger protein 579-like [Trifolium pratense]
MAATDQPIVDVDEDTGMMATAAYMGMMATALDDVVFGLHLDRCLCLCLCRVHRNTRGGRNEGRGGRGRGRGRGSGRGGGRTQHRQAQWPSYPYKQQWPSYPYPHPHQQWVGPWQPCATPPCPYPTAGNFHKQPGILGQKPQQAHVAATPTNPASQNASYSYAPTDIQAAMHTFSISPPDDQWYMDTGATSHMTANGGFSDRNDVNEM